MMGRNPDGWTWKTLKLLIDERHATTEKALRLQAQEYERRLEALNGERARERATSATFLTQEKFESVQKAERDARQLALDRVDERFQDHVKRYELRQRELDNVVNEQKLTISRLVDAQTKSAEDAKSAAEHSNRRFNRNLALATIVISIVVAVSNSGNPFGG